MPQEIIEWFYISPGLMRERKVQEYLEGKGMECFLPLTDKVVVRNGERKHYKVPYIHNMLFVRTDYNSLKQEKVTLAELGMPFAWKMLPGENKPIVIPDKTMDDFIRVCEERNTIILENYDPEKLKEGDFVEIIDGPFKGVRGYYCRPLKKHKSVVVLIEGIAAVSTTYIPQYSVKKVSETEN